MCLIVCQCLFQNFLVSFIFHVTTHLLRCSIQIDMKICLEISENVQFHFKREVTEDWMKANATHIFKKGKKEDSGSYRPVRLLLIPGKVMGS